MKTTELLDILGDVDDEMILDAKKNQKNRRFPRWAKWSSAIAACICIFLITGWGLSSYFSSYVKEHEIQLYSDTEGGDSLPASEVTEEQGKRISMAQELHMQLVQQDYDWYGGYSYDAAEDVIEIGLTEITEENKNIVLSYISEQNVRFVMCDYSYSYLEELYTKIDNRKWLLIPLGLERYSIAVHENYVLVYLSESDDNAAIYMINELDSIGGAVRFCTIHESYSNSYSRLQNVENPVYEIIHYEIPEVYETEPLYIATDTGLDAYDAFMASRYGEKYSGKGVRVFTFTETSQDSDRNVWYLDYNDTEISRLYYISEYEDRYIVGWQEAGEIGKAIESLAGLTSMETPMYLASDQEILYAIIGDTAYYLPGVFEPEVTMLPEIDTENTELGIIVLL